MTKHHNKKRTKRPKPLIHTPVIMKSRKRARQVTTLFHKLTKQRDEAIRDQNQQIVQQMDDQLEAMGGRSEYQRASQLSTMHHSTSKWVLGYLAQHHGNNGGGSWLIHGVVEQQQEMDGDEAKHGDKEEEDNETENRRRTTRPTRILEVGAINTELLDAADATVASATSQLGQKSTKKYNITVQAIDLHSMDPRIEEYDFLKFPYRSASCTAERYDVVVCSMVLNCVSTPQDRGTMLAKLYHHLRPEGLLFLTLPKFCLTKSAFLTLDLFQQMLQEGIGLDILKTKVSPKVAFFICSRPAATTATTTTTTTQRQNKLSSKWQKVIVRNKGKKFPNQFSVVLNEKDLLDDNVDKS